MIYKRTNINKINKSFIKNVDLIIIINEESNQKIEHNNIHCFNDLNKFYTFIKKENITEDTKVLLISNKDNINEYSNLLEFIIYYKNKLKQLSKEIINYNKTLIKDDNQIITNAINKFININCDGKFLRGCLIDLGYKLKKNDDKANPLSIAYETFQTAILVHDDIIDNAILRRNKETISYTYKKEFEKYNSNENLHNHLALCIGDLGFYYANMYITTNYKKNKNLSRLLEYYNDIVINTIKGEILDIQIPFLEKYDKNFNLKEENIFEIYKLKTSQYSITGPFALGMILSNHTEQEIKTMTDILMPLGIAFQIKDDILGIFSSKDILGKSVYSDIEEFKQTILYVYIKENKKEEYNELMKYYGKQNITETQAKKVQEIIINSGSLDYANNKLNSLLQTSKQQITNLNIKQNIKNILLGLITYLEIREN